MKCLIIGLIMSISISLFAQEGWQNQSPTYPVPELLAVYAIDVNNIWVTGREGTILHSKDGGASWDSVSSGVTERLYTVEFINSDTGWVAGDDNKSVSTVLRTIDAGLNWESQSLSGGGALSIYDVDFIKNSSGQIMCGYITGALGYTWKTLDFGANWNSVRNKCENTFYSSCFVNSDTGWFVGTPSVQEPYTIMNTMDGGDTWQQQTNPTGINLRGVCFGSDLRGIAVGLSGTILFTEDGGANWQTASSAPYARWESVFLTKSGKAWAVGSKGRIAYSTDWGVTWESQESGVSVDFELWEVYFINDSEGWIVGGVLGQEGVILHTSNSGITAVNEVKPDTPKEYSLKQNYPNPFNPVTAIGYRLSAISQVDLSVYNMLGQKIKTLVSESQQAGEYKVEWDASDFASGIYYYHLIAGEFQSIKKMVLIK